MPLKSTRPRKGSNPLIYAKLSPNELAALNQENVYFRLKRLKLPFTHKQYRTEQSEKLTQAILEFARQPQKSVLYNLQLGWSDGIILKFTKNKSGNMLIAPQPMHHFITGKFESNLYDLMQILGGRFVGGERPNATYNIKRGKRISPQSEDEFAIEIMGPAKIVKHEGSEIYHNNYGFVSYAKPHQISCVRVTISTKNHEARQKKEAKYREAIQKKYGVPVKFM